MIRVAATTLGMRLLAVVLLFVACCLAACAANDPADLMGTPILRRRTDHSKALRADGDDDDDTATTTKKKKTTVARGDGGTIDTVTGGTDDGAVFVPDGAKASAAPTAKSVEQQCYEIINKYRATKGLPALARWTNNESCSDGQSRSDSQSGAAHGAFGSCNEMAQNECPGYPSSAEQNLPECLADMFAEGPGGGHYENMTSTEYTMVSCGVFEVGDGTFWSVQDFR